MELHYSLCPSICKELRHNLKIINGVLQLKHKAESKEAKRANLTLIKPNSIPENPQKLLPYY